MKRIMFLLNSLLLLSILNPVFSDNGTGDDSLKYIKVHFLYGSVPKKEYKNKESKWFGGIHGGHVSIEIDSLNISFMPRGKFHIITHKNERHSIFSRINLNEWKDDTVTFKYTTFIIPVSNTQYESLKEIFGRYMKETPYDYAFIGMRCAAAAYDVLSAAGILEKHSRCKIIFRYFYPKLLRNKLYKLSAHEKFEIIYQNGRPTRKWEKDKRKYRQIISQVK